MNDSHSFVQPFVARTIGRRFTMTIRTAKGLLSLVLLLSLLLAVPARGNGGQPEPNDAKALVERGNAHNAKKDYDKAIADYTEAIKRDPKFAEAYARRAHAHAAKGEADRAIADSNAALELDPKIFIAYYSRGLAFNQDKEFDKAIDDLSKAIQLSPKSSRAFYGRGNAYLGKTDYDQAIKDYTGAIQLDPNFAGAYRKRSVAYDKLGKTDLAKADVQEARRLDAAKPGASDKNEPALPEKREPIVASVLEVTSKKYVEYGFKEYTFGSTQEQVEQKVVLSRQLNSEWLISKNKEEFLFIEGRLRGFAKSYVGNNEAYLATLIEILGPPSPKHTFRYPLFNSQTGRMSTFDNKGDILVTTVTKGQEERSFSIYPRTITCLRVIQSEETRSDKFGQTRNKQERLVLLMLDRDWAMSVLDKEMEADRRAITWLKKAVNEISSPGSVKLSDLPSFPGAHMRKSLPGGASNPLNGNSLVTRTFFIAGRDTKAKNVTPFIVAEQVLRDLPQDGKILPKGTTSITVQAGAMPDRRPNPVTTSVFAQLALLCDSALAQEFFPPNNATVKSVTKPNSNITSHEWRIKGGWKVVIDRGHRFQVVKEMNEP